MKTKGEIPFGPFMAAATVVIFLTRTPGGGNSILNWYFTTMF
jgi:prepilin signal peptidase PulO-like enzyme (type II secretory pathway)